jgi:uncharacterized protein (TIGR02118 family)
MIKVSVLYPGGPGNTFDWAYYLNSHTPMIRQKLGAALKGVYIDQGLAGGAPGTPPAYVTMCHLMFDSVESFQQAFDAHAAEILADIPNYTNSQPVVQISEVKL